MEGLHDPGQYPVTAHTQREHQSRTAWKGRWNHLMETQSGSNGTTVGGGGVNRILQWAVWKPFPPGLALITNSSSRHMHVRERWTYVPTSSFFLYGYVPYTLHSKVGSIIKVCRIWIHYKDSTTAASLRTTVCLCVCV